MVVVVVVMVVVVKTKRSQSYSLYRPVPPLVTKVSHKGLLPE
jgi:hypothetical protein